ncbi:hypothetical protein [Caulobacter sp. CCH9-E1]|jgi:hypothetical protein|uniref:hypothetical protein n=1 Tax=Caulobacter sp. CCH9-E1 TaxID=1768768 RepID=UPI000831B57F|nr:hypothetical protein [Caulobacter sp. CCH9-E1]
MRIEFLESLPNVVAALIVIGCIASIFGFRVRRPARSRTAAVPTAPQVDESAIPERPDLDRPTFGQSAQERLTPQLNALAERARAHGFEARYEVSGEGEAAKHRLEIKRPDHPAGQPLPYIAFSAGEAGLVDVIYGGMFPGPIDHNGADTEIDWRTVRWDQVDNVLATFAHKVFARFD